MVQKQQVIKEIRQSISEADTAKALGQMLDFLKANPRHNSMDQVARLAQAKYERTRRNLNQGVISIDDADLDFNAVNHTLLLLAQDLESDTFRLEKYEPDMRPSVWQKKVIGILLGILLVLAGGLSYWIYTNTIDSSKFTCPTFKVGSEFNVLLLPFQPDIQNKLAPHITIKRRLTDKSEMQHLNTSIEIATDYFEKNDTPGKEEATQVGNDCGAKMIIWGIWEDTANGTIISTDFKYLGNRDRFSFQKLKLESDSRVDTVFAMSDIETKGKLTEDIEKVIDNYFGLIAGLSGQPRASIEALKKSIPASSDTTAFLLNQMTLADSYLSMGDQKSAEQVYDSILAVHPNYGFARNNRGVLLYQAGKYGAAVEDLTVKLAETPNDGDALSSRASAYLKMEELKKAEDDLEKAKQCEPQVEGIDEKTKILQEKKAQKETEIKDATKKLKSDGNSAKILNKRAKAYRSLGEYELAIQDANKVIQLNAKNKEAYETLIDTYTDKEQPVRAKEFLIEGRAKGLDLKQLKEYPIVKRPEKNKE